MLRNLLLLLAALLCLPTVTLAGDLAIPADKEVIHFETKLGTVTFLHKMHAELSVTECTTCHHTLQAGDDRVKACHECHGSADGTAPKVKTAFHSTCVGCHEYTVAHGGEAGPLEKKCKLCHVK
ncbi:MAG: cytochrome c3 family protein [Pseudomonadota bacterium]